MSTYEDHLYVNRELCLWSKNSQYPDDRPQGNVLGARVKEVILSCCGEWRKVSRGSQSEVKDV